MEEGIGAIHMVKSFPLPKTWIPHGTLHGMIRLSSWTFVVIALLVLLDSFSVESNAVLSIIMLSTVAYMTKRQQMSVSLYVAEYSTCTMFYNHHKSMMLWFSKKYLCGVHVYCQFVSLCQWQKGGTNIHKLVLAPMWTMVEVANDMVERHCSHQQCLLTDWCTKAQNNVLFIWSAVTSYS